MSETQELTQSLDELAACVAQAERLLDDGVRTIAVEAAVEKFKNTIPEGLRSMLREDVLAEHRAAEEGKLTAEAERIIKDVAKVLPTARSLAEDAIATARGLPSFVEAEALAARQPMDRLDPAVRIGAMHLDLVATAEAERWIDAHTIQEATQRYAAASDRGVDRAFVRCLEQRHAEGRSVGAVDGKPEAVKAAIHAMTEAVQARREARVPQADREALARADAISGQLAKLRARLRPTMKNVGAAVRASLKAV